MPTLEDLPTLEALTAANLAATDLVPVYDESTKTVKKVTVASFATDTEAAALITGGTLAGSFTSLTNSGAFIGGVQSLSGAGAVNLTKEVTEYTSTGAAQALTLADGTAGQRKVIIHGVDGGSGVLTPTTKTGFTTITFTAVGDSCVLRYLTTRGWMIESLNGAVAA